MTTLDKVMQMQSQGMPEYDIAYALKNEGISAKEISDAFAQAKIKTAVSQPIPEEYQENYQSSQMQQTPVQQYSQSPQEQYAPQIQQPAQEQYAPYTQTPQAYGDQQGYYYPEQTQMNIETISEIVERLLIEKLKEINNKIRNISDFKIKAEEDMKDIKERLGRIESTIENLQRSVIGKVGEFGESTQMIHKDLENLHGTVSKLMNPLVDNYNELRKFNSKK
jgi:DNA-directed RNA polymerase specialized sigma subunit